MHRLRFLPLVIAALLTLFPVAARAQVDPAFEARRAEAQRALQQAQAQLSEIRGQRLQLQARIENAIATAMQQRARQLVMSEEQTALQQLDAMLLNAQNTLLEQRDRVSALGESVRRRTGAVLVVLFRADSAGAAQTLASVQTQISNVAIGSREYSAVANAALQRGAIDELYRADVLPGSINVRVQAVANNQPVAGAIDVNAIAETITYVQFALRDGQLVATSWTSRGVAP